MTAKGSQRYFVTPAVDFLLVGGGSAVLFLLLPFFASGVRTPQIIQIGMWLTWIGNWPHFAATSYRLYGRSEHLRQYPITAVAALLIAGAGVAGSVAWPLAFAPFFVKLFLVWSPYHYSGQTLGISLLYARRGGHKPEALERFLLTAFIYGTFLMRTLAAEVGAQGTTYYGIQIPGFGIPKIIATAFLWWTYACGAAFLTLLAARAIRARKAPPPMYLLPAATQYVWFVVAGTKPGFAELVPFFHGLQYLLVAWALQMSMQIQERMDRQGEGSSTPVVSARFVGAASLRWYALIAALGAGLFYVLPHAVARAGIPLALASAAVLAAIQVHHFFVDGVIWKLKSTSVVSPLLVNIPALVTKRPRASEPAESAPETTEAMA